MAKPVASPAFFAPLLLGCACALITACGGGGGGSSAPPPPTPVTTIPEGVWGGSITVGNTPASASLAVVLGDGSTAVVETNSYLVTTTLGTGTSAAMAYAPLGLTPFSNGTDMTSASVTVTGVTAKTAFNGTGTIDGNPVTFNFNQYIPAYDTPLMASAVAGVYSSASDNNSTQGNLALTLNADGTLTGNGAAGLAIQGTYTIPDPSKSGFKATFTQTAPGQPPSTWTGIGASYSNSGAGIILAATSSAGGFAGHFTLVASAR